MNLERGLASGIPYAAIGSGSPIVVAAGLWPSTGVDSDGLVRGAFAPLRPLSGRRLIVLNRRAGLPANLTMSDLATEYAEAIRALCDSPVDVMGASTGGSIVQQLAADHPATVRRLVLLSTACRLGTFGRDVSSRVAALLRSGRTRSALGLVGMSLAPRGFRTLARATTWAAAGRLIADSVGAADLAATLEAEEHFDLARCLQPIQATTLIIAGERDRFYSPELFAETAALIPRSQLHLVPSRGHITVATSRRAQATIAGFLNHPVP